MRIYYFFVLTISILLSSAIFAQDTITFLSGKTLTGKILESNVLITKIEIHKKKNLKIKEFESDEIFNILYASGESDTLYETNEDKEFFLTTEEMHYFILGEQDAQKHYHPRASAIGGLVFGGVFGYILHNGAYVAGVPLVYTIGSAISPVNINNIANRTTTILSSPAYQEGYIKVARTKKAFYALASSAVGTLVGVLVAHGSN